VLKFLFNLAVIIIVGYIIYVKFFKKPKQLSSNQNEFKKMDSSIMVSCDKCGTFVEANDSIIKDGKFFCSKECAGVK
jgi:uncharacterized protein